MTLHDAQCVANITAKYLKLKKRPVIQLDDSTERGYAYIKGWIIFLPTKLLNKSVTYTTYYIAHEVCHFVKGCAAHNKKFCETEDKALAFWGISIKRGKDKYPIDIRKK